MGLRDKASKIDLGDLDKPSDGAGQGAQPPAPAAATPATTPTQVAEPVATTAPAPAPRRSGVAAITQSIAAHHRVQDLETELAMYKDGKTVVQLDPKRIRQSRWKNRHEMSFLTQDFLDLKAEIESAGGNVQPIKVRKVGQGGDGGDEFEIVFGRRRHRCCLELGLPVNAIVVAKMSDEELFAEMDRENRNRADLTPWEQGVMYKDALDSGLFASQRQLAAKLGVDQGNVSKAVRLATLPDAVVNAFPSALDIQFRWGDELIEALERDPVKVTALAEEIASMEARPSAKEVLARLVQASQPDGEGASQVSKALRIGGKVVGSLNRDRRGAIALKVKGGSLAPAAERRLMEFLEKLFPE